MSEFDRDIALTPTGPQAYAADLRPGWVVGGGVNGGYLLATLAHAVRQESTHPDPFTISAYYLSATREGPPPSPPASCARVAAPRRTPPTWTRRDRPGSAHSRRSATWPHCPTTWRPPRPSQTSLPARSARS